jgi:hypothetical protein
MFLVCTLSGVEAFAWLTGDMTNKNAEAVTRILFM